MTTASHPPTFAERLEAAVRRCRNPVCVGLDPRCEQLPAGLRPPGSATIRQKAEACRAFCREVIDVVAPLVPAVKPQVAFFEQLGPHGMSALADVLIYARERGLLVVADAKRNDIGSTAEAYADAWLGPPGESAWGADALTVSPYLGTDSLAPFVEVATARGAGLFVLVKTSNPGSGEFQDRQTDGQTLYQRVAAEVERLSLAGRAAGGYGSIGAVVGATYPQQLADLRQRMPHVWLLIPGFGHQGGAAADVAAGFDEHGTGALVNNSRGIIFAHSRKEFAQKYGDARWQQAVGEATRLMIAQLSEGTRAGRLSG